MRFVGRMPMRPRAVGSVGRRAVGDDIGERVSVKDGGGPDRLGARGADGAPLPPSLRVTTEFRSWKSTRSRPGSPPLGRPVSPRRPPRGARSPPRMRLARPGSGTRAFPTAEPVPTSAARSRAWERGPARRADEIEETGRKSRTRRPRRGAAPKHRTARLLDFFSSVQAKLSFPSTRPGGAPVAPGCVSGRSRAHAAASTAKSNASRASGSTPAAAVLPTGTPQRS